MTKLKYKLILAIVSASFVSLFILSCYNIFDTVRKNDSDVQEYRKILLQQFDRNIKLEVETIHAMIQTIYNQQQAGLLTEEEAKKRAAGLVRNIQYDNGNYFWIDTTKGVTVAFLGKSQEGKSRFDAVDSKGEKYIQKIIKNAMNPKGGYTDYWFPKPGQTEQLPKRSYSLLFKPYKWVIGTGNWIDDIDKLVAVKAKENHRKLTMNIAFAVLIGLAGLIISALMAMYMSKKISDPVAAMAVSVHQLADGDFTPEDLAITTKDEIGVLSTSFNEMKTNLRDLIKQVAGMAEQVASSSEELTATSDQSARASSQIASSITEVAAGAAGQVKEVFETSSVIEQMSANIQHVTDNVKEVAAVSDKTATAAQIGEKAVNTAISQMANIEKTVTESSQVITKLGERSKEIGQIVDTISGIAGQTNLLALNAAIEAARAGEQGRGFAVVAEEVRKLAEQSHEASKQITDLIREIQVDTNKAVIAMDTGTREARVGTEVVGTAGGAFNEIASLVDQVSTQIKEIAAAVQELAAGSRQIVSAVREIDKITRTTASETQTVSAATEEQSAAMEEIAAASQSLAHLAQDLQNAIIKFKV
ncbi:chemotaxis methyl-accepting receptor [Lucifera butyrica]|uniref:Chemotaxis methyl-accepting receptor n=1 Tax=Lucifera butyrica TaxID=1351585 RepID=A0A498RBL1_9FIRM|nr:methyl-accepting chemotaxis protein [Lucifera butyrica]VBB08330.1 chemotaxis methyl-accepting receptor [Lucifera butyrica]VBB08402.1 chemotaxis methyl-accepting receptor [Lucifera butyrica]